MKFFKIILILSFALIFTNCAKEKIVLSNENNIKSFRIGNIECQIDSISNKITAYLDTTLNNLQPTITISPKAKLSTSSSSIKDYTSPIMLTVTSESGNSRTFLVDLYSLKDKIIGDYNLNNNILDLSSLKNNAVSFNVEFSANRHGQALSCSFFNGNDSYLKINRIPALNLGGDENKQLSISFWYKASDTQNHLNSNWVIAPLIHKGGGASKDHDFAVQFGTISSNSNKFIWSTGNSQDICSYMVFANPSSNQWHHVVVTYNSNTKEKSAFVDNILISKCSFNTLPIDLGYDITIGKGVVYDYLASNFYKGYIDDLKFYNKVLSNEEISALNKL